MKHFAVFASCLLAVTLVPPALAQDNEAEILFRTTEKKIKAAEAVEVAFTYDVEKRTTKGTLLLTKDNKARLKVSGYFADQRNAAFELVSDGKQLKTKGARFLVASNGVPGVEKGGQSAQETPKKFHVQLGALVSRGGMWFSLFVMPYLLREGIDPDAEGSKVNAYDFQLGAAEKVGEREAKVLRYRFGKGGSCPDDPEIILWVDGKTLLPLKRVIDLRKNRGVVSGVIITESYNEFTLDPKINARAFELARVAVCAEENVPVEKLPKAVVIEASAVDTFRGQEVPLDELPKAVAEAVKKRLPKAKLRVAAKRIEDNKTDYRVDAKNGDLYIGLTVTAEGRITAIVKEIESEQLPKEVTQFLNKKYPKHTGDAIDELIDVREGKENLNYYRVALLTADAEKRLLFFSPEGKLVKEEK